MDPKDSNAQVMRLLNPTALEIEREIRELKGRLSVSYYGTRDQLDKEFRDSLARIGMDTQNWTENTKQQFKGPVHNKEELLKEEIQSVQSQMEQEFEMRESSHVEEKNELKRQLNAVEDEKEVTLKQIEERYQKKLVEMQDQLSAKMNLEKTTNMRERDVKVAIEEIETRYTPKIDMLQSELKAKEDQLRELERRNQELCTDLTKRNDYQQKQNFVWNQPAMSSSKVVNPRETPSFLRKIWKALDSTAFTIDSKKDQK